MPVSLLADWGNFYVITGSAAAALTGLTFVVIALAAGAIRVSTTGLRAFITPTIVHFGTVLALAAFLSVPHQSLVSLSLGFGAVGVGGVIYGVVITFFAFGLFELARRSGYFPAELVETFEPVIQEESRHILFFINWAAWYKRNLPWWRRPQFFLKTCAVWLFLIWERVAIAKGADTDRGAQDANFAMTGSRCARRCGSRPPDPDRPQIGPASCHRRAMVVVHVLIFAYLLRPRSPQ
jgi:hypothetical protein